MADVKLEQKQTLGREEAARLVAALAAGLSDDGKVTVEMGSSTLELAVADQVDFELEVSVDGDEIELELELKWSTSARLSAEAEDAESEDTRAEEDEAEAGEAEEDEAEAGEAEEDEAEAGEAEEGEGEAGEAEEDEAEDEAGQVALEAEPDQQDSDEDESGRDLSAAEAQDGVADADADADATPSVEAESLRAVPANRAPRPRRGRRSAAADTGQSASNGVDTAAVRAWAAANGLSVSPRGRIRDEVLQAYRDAGN